MQEEQNIKLTYIASALHSFASVSGILESAKKLSKENEYSNLLSDILYRMDGYSDNCGLGTLWNSMTEKKEKAILRGLTNRPYNELICQSDSGGLQVLTLGLEVSPEEQIESYQRQAIYSTHSMSMDIMPIRVNENLREQFSSKGNGGQGLKINHSIKFFVKELRYISGRESGFKIKDQIDVFESLGEECISKVLVILQGWSIEDYDEYARGVFSVFNEMEPEVRSTYYKHIGGISLGTSGLISYFRMLDLYCRAPIDLVSVPEEFRSFIHILGLGGNNKSGILFALSSNFFNKKVHYTYDSTSLTSSSAFGRYTKLKEMSTNHNNKEYTYHKMIMKQLGRKISPTVIEFMESIRLEYGDLIEKHLNIDCSDSIKFRNNFSPWRDDGCTSPKDFEEAFKTADGLKAREEYLNAIQMNAFLHMAIETKQFMTVLDEMKQGIFYSIGDKEYRKAMILLSTIPSYTEYMKRRNEFKAILGFKPEPGSDEEQYHIDNPSTLPNKKEKRAPSMTYVKTLEDFENICNLKFGIDEEEW